MATRVYARRNALPAATQLTTRKGDAVRTGDVTVARRSSVLAAIDEGDLELPDILTVLQDRTQLTRRSLCRILTGSLRARGLQAHDELLAKAT